MISTILLICLFWVMLGLIPCVLVTSRMGDDMSLTYPPLTYLLVISILTGPFAFVLIVTGYFMCCWIPNKVMKLLRKLGEQE